MSTFEILLDDSRGIYIPMKFIELFAAEDWHVTSEQVEILKTGPHVDLYWDTWDEVLRDAFYISPMDSKTLKPGRWTLEQDGALFARHETHESEDSI